jgi:hypothetical protein
MLHVCLTYRWGPPPGEERPRGCLCSLPQLHTEKYVNQSIPCTNNYSNALNFRTYTNTLYFTYLIAEGPWPTSRLSSSSKHFTGF